MTAMYKTQNGTNSNALSLRGILSWSAHDFLQIDEDWTGFAYISDGAGKIGGTKGKREQALVLGKGDTIHATTDNPEGMR